jgi:uncharacterized protein with HEPN domain
VVDRLRSNNISVLRQPMTQSTPSETETAALRDMLHHIDAAQIFSNGQTYERVRDDLMRLYAIIRCLEIISEASCRLSDSLRARHSEIPQGPMASAGNFPRHQYDDVTPRST